VAVAGTAGRDAFERVQCLDERKDVLADDVQALEEQLDRLARETRRTAKEASRALREAAGGIRDNKLKGKIRYSKGVVRGRPGETAQQFEDVIAGDIDELSRQVADAAQALSEAKGDPRTAALERTRDLVSRMESIQERVRQDPPQPGQEAGEGAEGATPGEAGGNAEGGTVGGPSGGGGTPSSRSITGRSRGRDGSRSTLHRHAGALHHYTNRAQGARPGEKGITRGRRRRGPQEASLLTTASNPIGSSEMNLPVLGL
jgi:hypothetical protein